LEVNFCIIVFQSISFCRLPVILIIHLKRFRYEQSSSYTYYSQFSSGGSRIKIDIDIKYPVFIIISIIYFFFLLRNGLDLRKFEKCSPSIISNNYIKPLKEQYSFFDNNSESSSNSKNDQSSSSSFQYPPIYDLFGVSVHSGTCKF
jgi:hypothetical protein